MNMETKRTTPEFITELQPNEIFVFGSNLKGMHGGGAAYIAYRKFGAIMGQGVGLHIAGFTDDEISPLFEKAHDAENIVLPPGW